MPRPPRTDFSPACLDRIYILRSMMGAFKFACANRELIGYDPIIDGGKATMMTCTFRSILDREQFFQHWFQTRGQTPGVTGTGP